MLRLRSFTLFLLCASTIASAAPAKRTAASAPNPVQDLIERYTANSRLLATVYTDQFSPTTRTRFARFNADWKPRTRQFEIDHLPGRAQVQTPA